MTQHRLLIAFLVISMLALSSVPLSALGKSFPRQTVTCPTYLTNLEVDFVDSNPRTAEVGTIIVTIVHVIYPDGTPVTALSPETISFLWSSATGQWPDDDAPVTRTDRPGYWNYTQTITDEMLTALGTGLITITVVLCSISDIFGNRGPTGPVNSDTTFTPSDLSKVGLEIPPSGPQPVSYVVPLVIALLLIIALLLFILRARRKKK